MAIVLGPNQFGKAETRLVRVHRDGEKHSIVDLNITTALAGDFADSHLTGDNAKLLPTDSQRAAAFAFAREAPIEHIESFALRLARHFVDDTPHVDRARIVIDQYPWRRIEAGGSPEPTAFVRDGGHVRTATVTYAGGRAWAVSGLKDLVVLKTTHSEFHGFLKDRYTTLAETDDRIMATSVTARWRHQDTDPNPTSPDGTAWDAVDWTDSFDRVLRTLLAVYAEHHSLALQQTLYAMARAVLEDQPGIAEIRLSLPNRHHVALDLSPYGLDNPNVVFHATDRPYGLIEAVVTRDDAPDPGPAWSDLA